MDNFIISFRQIFVAYRNTIKMSIHKNSRNSINFINLLMKNINNLTDDIYESLMDEDYISLNSSIKELQSVLRETQKLTEDEI